MCATGEDSVHVDMQVRGVPQRGGDAGAHAAPRARHAQRRAGALQAAALDAPQVRHIVSTLKPLFQVQ